MYLDWIRLQNFRAFRDVEIELIHPDRDFAALDMPRPRLPNLNLLLGDNGLGKSAFLKGVALAALGPAVGDAGIYPYRLVRREPLARRRPGAWRPGVSHGEARLSARFRSHEQDHVPEKARDLEDEVHVIARGDLEKLVCHRADEKLWRPIFQAASDGFFFAGYGSSRHVARREQADLGARRASLFVRAQRVQGLFQEAFPLIPLAAWLPEMKERSPERFTQVKNLINRLIGEERYRFTGSVEAGEYVYSRGGLKVPFPALSDGYRAYLGWIGDLLYHMATTGSPGKRLVDMRGIVMIDEIDLHLHPAWQMTVLDTLARQLPNLQFIVTSHSPLLVGTLEWMNIVVMKAAEGESSQISRIPQAVRGLDADQILLTEFFGIPSTRAGDKQRRLKDLAMRARHGDLEAAKRLMEEMAQGSEAAQ